MYNVNVAIHSCTAGIVESYYAAAHVNCQTQRMRVPDIGRTPVEASEKDL